jgi:hypothetical protein
VSQDVAGVNALVRAGAARRVLPIDAASVLKLISRMAFLSRAAGRHRYLLRLSCSPSAASRHVTSKAGDEELPSRNIIVMLGIAEPATKGERNVLALLRAIALRLLAVTMLGSVVSLTGCAAIAKDQQAYDTQQCQNFGLIPGSDAYIQCISQGANAYAASRNNNNAAANPTAAGIAVLPIAIPLIPQPPGQNNSCSAPKSSPRGACPGCSVSCSAQHASCSPGQEFPGGSDICMQDASCACQ